MSTSRLYQIPQNQILVFKNITKEEAAEKLRNAEKKWLLRYHAEPGMIALDTYENGSIRSGRYALVNDEANNFLWVSTNSPQDIAKYKEAAKKNKDELEKPEHLEKLLQLLDQKHSLKVNSSMLLPPQIATAYDSLIDPEDTLQNASSAYRTEF